MTLVLKLCIPCSFSTRLTDPSGMGWVDPLPVLDGRWLADGSALVVSDKAANWHCYGLGPGLSRWGCRATADGKGKLRPHASQPLGSLLTHCVHTTKRSLARVHHQMPCPKCKAAWPSACKTLRLSRVLCRQRIKFDQFFVEENDGLEWDAHGNVIFLHTQRPAFLCRCGRGPHHTHACPQSQLP